MTRIKLPLSVLLLSGTLDLADTPAWAAEGIISKDVVIPEGNYCRLRFPAIRPETLYWSRPVLKDLSDGDIIDFYGFCDHDPLGRDEILRQRQDLQRERGRAGD